MRHLYLADPALLVAHEIDPALRRGWDLFGLPMGEAGFLAVHVPLGAAVVWGHGRLGEGARAGALLSLALAVAGLGAAALHGLLLARGGELRAPASVAVPSAVLLVSASQAPLALRALRSGASRAPP